MHIPARVTSVREARSLQKIGAFMAAATLGQEAILPALTRTHMGRTPPRKCCASFAPTPWPHALSWPKSRSVDRRYYDATIIRAQRRGAHFLLIRGRTKESSTGAN